MKLLYSIYNKIIVVLWKKSRVFFNIFYIFRGSQETVRNVCWRYTWMSTWKLNSNIWIGTDSVQSGKQDLRAAWRVCCKTPVADSVEPARERQAQLASVRYAEEYIFENFAGGKQTQSEEWAFHGQSTERHCGMWKDVQAGNRRRGNFGGTEVSSNGKARAAARIVFTANALPQFVDRSGRVRDRLLIRPFQHRFRGTESWKNLIARRLTNLHFRHVFEAECFLFQTREAFELFNFIQCFLDQQHAVFPRIFRIDRRRQLFYQAKCMWKTADNPILQR